MLPRQTNRAFTGRPEGLALAILELSSKAVLGREE